MKLGASEFPRRERRQRAEDRRWNRPFAGLYEQQPNWKPFLPVMAPNGTVYPLTVSEEEFKMPYGLINAMQLWVQGSLAGAWGDVGVCGEA
jgi:hypothetical protein